MQRDAYLGGVKNGGLTSSTEIRILLCYLIAMSSPVTREALENALLGEELVNYFELVSNLEDLVKQGLVEKKNEEYFITPKGKSVSDALGYDLPRSVRESAIRAVIRAQSWLRKAAQHKAEILQENGRFTVRCHIEEMGCDVFSLSFAMPDLLTAEMLKQQFIDRGDDIYARILQDLTTHDEKA